MYKILLLLLLFLNSCSGKNIFGVEEEKEYVKGKRVNAVDNMTQYSLDGSNIKVHLTAPQSPRAMTFSNGSLNYGPDHIISSFNNITKNYNILASSDTDQKFIIIEDYLFAYSTNHKLVAYKLDDLSSPIWKQKIPHLGKNNNMNSGGISFENGIIYVANGSSQITAVSAFDGRILWTTKVDGELFKSMPFAFKGKVIVLSIYNKIYSLDGENGDILWMHQSVPESNIINIYPSPVVISNIVLVPYNSGLLSAIDVNTGNNIWDVNLASKSLGSTYAANNLTSTPIVYNDIVFVAGNMGYVFAIDIKSGAVIWFKEVQGVKSIWANANFLYMVDSDNKVLAMHMFDGTVKWSQKIKVKEEVSLTGPILVNNKLLIISSDGCLYYIDIQSGDILQKEKVKSKIKTIPKFSSNNMYLLNNDGNMSVFY